MPLSMVGMCEKHLPRHFSQYVSEPGDRDALLPRADVDSEWFKASNPSITFGNIKRRYRLVRYTFSKKVGTIVVQSGFYRLTQLWNNR